LDIKELFQPGADVMETIDTLTETLDYTTNKTLSESELKGDCTSCWGGTCASGITG